MVLELRIAFNDTVVCPMSDREADLGIARYAKRSFGMKLLLA